ncbi:LAME_0D09340g1_1 [Lachancea meyersii CBS 8951]|uniref:LAME_0D09340g1_1 n=1 Tax=Lachancea meyersii CBS 8951 TaxID=1266667 RepID=A0A1G4JB15_9SACH|nr:LAME_0D09340g1_1 [Lachancea meyersii CBS 8951]
MVKTVLIPSQPLSLDQFKNYGSIISPDEEVSKLGDQTKGANQGTAIKVLKVSQNQNLFPDDCGIKASHWNLFRSFPRPHLQRAFTESPTNTIVEHSISVLEKHPYSSQTFVPMGRAAKAIAYIVVVALSNEQGEPDLSTLRSFTCKGTQAVTYGAGVWHAPMIVVGPEEYLDFSVAIYELGDSTKPEMDLVERFYSSNELVVTLNAV